MINAKNILVKFTKNWQLLVWLDVFLYALALGAFVYLLSLNWLLAFVFFLITFLISSFLKKPWEINLQKTSKFIDEQLEEVEYSSSLFLKDNQHITSIAKLQQAKVEQKLIKQINSINPPTKLKQAGVFTLLFLLFGFLGYTFNIKDYFINSATKNSTIENINFNSVNPVATKYLPPKIMEQSLRIAYPLYTRLGVKKTSNMSIKAVEGSKIYWSLQFDKKIKSVSIESMGNSYEMKLKNGAYQGSSLLKNSGFYSFKFIDTLNNTYTSKLYTIDVTQDKEPKIDITSLEKRSVFEFYDKKLLNFSSIVTDDYGLNEAYIIATVSKGTGESVKFREEKLSFNKSISKGEKSVKLDKQINLDNLKMEPGDELYFYVEASDLKTPQKNVARSDTYFAVIKDTVSDQFAVEATMGVNRMPDYFRSQRQLIIDTKKLIKNKKNLTKYEFEFKSNELGFEQKALRIKYATFMGEENENMDIVDEENLEALENDNEHDHDDHNHDEEDDKNPIKDFMHDHDHENEHNLVGNKKKEEDPVEKFKHNHSDPEEATLFEESLKVKLLKALQQMWDAELQLRLYKPKASLPYQYKALKYLQEIKNSARIYVHRIGFDPPPIKEEKRLTGELDDIKNFSKQEELVDEDKYKFMKLALIRLETLIQQKEKPIETDKTLFEEAGNELAILAIENPGKYLVILQNLKELILLENKDVKLLKSTRKGLLEAIPNSKPNPNKTRRFKDGLKDLVIKELQVNGR